MCDFFLFCGSSDVWSDDLLKEENRSRRPTTSKSNSEVWMQPNKRAAEKVMLDREKLAQESKVPQLMKMTITIMACRTGLLTWYDCPISTGKAEGINNKVKVMKKVAYGLGKKTILT